MTARVRHGRSLRLALKGVGAAVLVALLVSVTGRSARAGGESCANLCSLENACPGAQQQNCVTSCASTAALDTASGCDALYADYLACKGLHQDEVCNLHGASCVDAKAAYFACVGAFCDLSPVPSACR